MNALTTVTSAMALIGTIGGGVLFLDDRHAHTAIVDKQVQAVEDDLQLTARQASMEMIDLRIQILEARIRAEQLKKAKTADDLDRIKRLRKQQDMLREIKMKGRVQ